LDKISNSNRVSLLRNNWLACLVVIAAIPVVVHLTNDYRSGSEFGWDVRVNCAAVEAHSNGLNPYYVKNLKDTNLSYPYLPVTLDAFRPLCVDGFLTRHYRGIYLAVAALSVLLLCSFGISRRSLGDVCLKALCVFGGFAGFEWALVTGNLAVISGLLTALALSLFLSGLSAQENNSGNEAPFAPYAAGAAVFGLLISLKVIFLPLLLSFYFLPLSRRRKIILMVVAAVCFAAPGLISLLFYHDLFFSWIDAITGQIPGQHSPALEGCNPSLLCLGQAVSENSGLVHQKLVGTLFYGFAATLLVIGPLAGSLVRLVRNERMSDDRSFLQRLDRLLIERPRLAMRVAVLSMFALYLCAPRLKEYAYFELAIYAAALIVDLPATAIAAVLAGTVVAPILAMQTHNPFVSTYGQTAAALFCFWIVLSDLDPSVFGLRESKKP